MFLKKSNESEIVESLTANLAVVKNFGEVSAFDKRAKAMRKIAEAANIFDEAGFDKLANKLTGILEKFAEFTSDYESDLDNELLEFELNELDLANSYSDLIALRSALEDSFSPYKNEKIELVERRIADLQNMDLTSADDTNEVIDKVTDGGGILETYDEKDIDLMSIDDSDDPLKTSSLKRKNRLTKFAAICPSCGDSNAYMGLNDIECTTDGCKNYSEKQYESMFGTKKPKISIKHSYGITPFQNKSARIKQAKDIIVYLCEYLKTNDWPFDTTEPIMIFNGDNELDDTTDQYFMVFDDSNEIRKALELDAGKLFESEIADILQMLPAWVNVKDRGDVGYELTF